jgi:hypothetical protein
MAGHTKGDKVKEFCSLRKDTCPCGESYQEHCVAEASAWEAQAAGSSKYVQRYGSGARRRSYEAHHIACVAAVTGIITVNEEIRSIVEQTKWCVNRKNNMIALPLWPHTIEWYFNLGARTLKQTDEPSGRRKPSTGPPPYAGLAHHDYDHGEYIEEVNLDLRRVAARAQRAAEENHDDPTGNLAGALDGVIDKHKANLQGRSTHAAWEQGMNGEANWYKQFSMSQDNPSERAFPAPSNELWEKMLEVAAAFLKL